MGQIYAHKPKIGANKTDFFPEKSYSAPAIPNSLLLAMRGDFSDTESNSELENIMKSRLAAFRRQIPAAENEADRLSAGITTGTPEQVKQSMGERLGTDFSSVRFHTGESISQKADSMGARAWTQGNDVYFGEGGFHPTVAAHELVHTAQQGAVSNTAVHALVPMGEVQMWSWGDPFRWIRRQWKAWRQRRRAQQQQRRQQRENDRFRDEYLRLIRREKARHRAELGPNWMQIIIQRNKQHQAMQKALTKAEIRGRFRLSLNRLNHRRTISERRLPRLPERSLSVQLPNVERRRRDRLKQLQQNDEGDTQVS